jgi:uncharacterized protein
MKLIKFLIAGIFFGIVMAKSEAISWYRIQEMFRFQSFHMFGIMAVAVIIGVVGVALIKKFNVKDIYGEPIKFTLKENSITKYLFGGIIFGLGWALTGACPGPIVVNIGYGFLSLIAVFVFAILGTYLYGIVKEKLPH